VVAHRVEQEVIEWLRIEKSIGPAFRTGDGWTETVPSHEISLFGIAKKVKELSGSAGEPVPDSRFLG